MRVREKGKGVFVYKVYRLLTSTLSPFLKLHLQWRRFRGLEHPLRWPERLGRPSLLRPPGPLIYFHAVSLGEGMSAIPIITRCISQRPAFNVLMTTTTLSAFEVLKKQLPPHVIYQLVPHASLRQWIFLLLLMLSLATGNQMLLSFLKVNCGPILLWLLQNLSCWGMCNFMDCYERCERLADSTYMQAGLDGFFHTQRRI